MLSFVKEVSLEKSLRELKKISEKKGKKKPKEG